MKYTLTALAGAAALAMMAPVVSAQTPPAQSDPVADAMRARGEAYRRGSDEVQDPEEMRTTSALNAEILEQNDLAELQDRANQRAHAKAQAEYQEELDLMEMETRRIEQEAAAREAAYKAELAAYERAQADWRACVGGDKTRCATTPQ
ncbi:MULTISPECIES: cell wall hydrolase [unclassified Brevundimonas]|uniref:cell wall hydrolase n=1 Tax=unclassified Brevundimonas TaxID=2622653 RepID=UPI0025C44BF4|nr:MULTISPECIES: cell wall hydrolase [unclassified Brevundimonas]